MNSSNVKTVLIGISGGVAAYKSCEVLRGLQKAGVRVKVVMTEHATHFVNPLTFRALTNDGAEHFVLVRKAAVKHPRRNARSFRNRAHGSVRKALFHELCLCTF